MASNAAMTTVPDPFTNRSYPNPDGTRQVSIGVPDFSMSRIVPQTVILTGKNTCNPDGNV